MPTPDNPYTNLPANLATRVAVAAAALSECMTGWNGVTMTEQPKIIRLSGDFIARMQALRHTLREAREAERVTVEKVARAIYADEDLAEGSVASVLRAAGYTVDE